MISIQILKNNDEDKVLKFLQSNGIDCNIKYIDEEYEEVVDNPPHTITLNRIIKTGVVTRRIFEEDYNE